MRTADMMQPLKDPNVEKVKLKEAVTGYLNEQVNDNKKKT